MSLNQLGFYILRKKIHNISVVLACSLCVLFAAVTNLPVIGFFSFIGIIVVGLVTLHEGSKNGFLLLCISILPSIVGIAFIGEGTTFGQQIALNVFVWMMAATLASSYSWPLALYSGVALGSALIAALHMAIPDVSQYWFQILSSYATQASSLQNNISVQELTPLLEKLSHFTSGLMVSGIMLVSGLLLVAARGWQANLFNPAGLSQEWRKIRIVHLYSILLIIVIAGIWLDVDYFKDILAIILVPFLFAGLSLLHSKLPDKKETRVIVLIFFYTSMLFLFQYMSGFLVLLGFLDSCFDFRSLRRSSR